MATSSRKLIEWAIYGPDGSWERWHLPRCFGADDVQAKRPHGDVWMFVPAGFHVFIRTPTGVTSQFVDGEKWVLWSRATHDFTYETTRKPWTIEDAQYTSICRNALQMVKTA